MHLSFSTMATEKFIQYNNSQIFYPIVGQGKPVILLHGFGEDGNIWNAIGNKLSKEFLLIIPDLPGSGKSEILKGVNISMEDYADVIKSILEDALKLEKNKKAAVIGHSMGGYIALAFAEKYPEILDGLGLFHSTAFADTAEKIETRLKGIEFIKNNGAHAFLKTSIQGLFTQRFKDEHPETVTKLINEGLHFTDAALIQYYQAMINRPDRTKVLRECFSPVLFISGEEDKAVPLKFTLQECHLPEVAQINILVQTAHMGMLEQANKSSEVLSSFLNIL